MDDLFKLQKKGIPITLIGLPYVGKTTLVNRLKDERFTRPKPTIGVNFEPIQIGDLSFNIFDISGQKSYRSTIFHLRKEILNNLMLSSCKLKKIYVLLREFTKINHIAIVLLLLNRLLKKLVNLYFSLLV